MNWFLAFLLVCSLAVNALLALVIADIRAEQKAARREAGEELDRELLRIVNGHGTT